VTAIQPITIGGTGGISGTTTAMEYRVGTTGSWTTCAAGSTTGLQPGSYQVRLSVTGSSFVGAVSTVTINGSQQDVPVTSIRIAAMPAITVKRGETVKFDLILNEGARSDGIVWTVNNTSYATVDPVNGTVTILNKTGTVVLVATDTASGLSHSVILRIT
jgi:hypothetical protein